MKTIFKTVLALMAVATLSISCSSSSDDSQSTSGSTFTINGQTFTLLPTNGIVEQMMDNKFTYQNAKYDRSAITINGLNGTTQSGTVSFDLYYKDGLPVEGTYQINNALDDFTTDFETQLVSLQKVCMGWTSATLVTNLSTMAQTSGNNPSGTVTVVKNSTLNYTIKFNGSYKVYNSSFNVTSTIPVVVDVTGNVTKQTI